MEMEKIQTLFYKLPENIVKCFWRRNILFHIYAVGLTYIIVISGFDWLYFVHTRNNIFLLFFFPAIVIGYIAPFLLPLGVYIIGKGKKDWRKLNTAFALGQATIISLSLFLFYKIVTGRPAPEFFHT